MIHISNEIWFVITMIIIFGLIITGNMIGPIDRKK